MDEPLLEEEDFYDAGRERGPIWIVRVYLAFVRRQGMEFEEAWWFAMQRLRVQPNMEPEDIEELQASKAWLNWARPEWEAAYNRTPSPPLIDGECFAPSERTVLDTSHGALAGTPESA